MDNSELDKDEDGKVRFFNIFIKNKHEASKKLHRTLGCGCIEF